ncbi:MAG: GPR1/FUN34/YaaH family transporter [Solirubrobacteraceae bacterium]
MPLGDNSAVAGTAIRINVRPLASPLPLGLFAFGIGMVLLAAQTAGWIPVREATQVGLLLAAFVFPLEGVATIIAFLARDALAATALGIFTTSWLALGVSLIIGAPGAISPALGFYLLAFTAPVISLALVGVAGKPLIALLLWLSAARALVDGIYQFTASAGVEHAAGYIAATIALLSWYGGTALLVEDVRQRTVLPVFRRGSGRAALEGGLGAQLERAQRDAGVRQQL